VDFPERFHLIIRRLKGAASDSKVKKQMKEEDEILKYLRNFARIEAAKKDKLIEEKDRIIAEKDKEIEELKRQLRK